MLAIALGACTVESSGPSDAVVAEPVEDAADRESPDAIAADSGAEVDAAARPDDPAGDAASQDEVVCCQEAADCGEGRTCVGASGGEPGRCVDAASGWSCWSDSDCSSRPGPEICVLENVCGCDDDCQPSHGFCEAQGSCCDEDDDCASPGFEGRCFLNRCVSTQPAGDRCWEDEDCDAEERCGGAFVCPCGILCEPTYEGLGYCLAQVGPCFVLPSEAFCPAPCEPCERGTGLLPADVAVFYGTSCLVPCLSAGGDAWSPPPWATFPTVADCEATCLPP